MLAEYIAYVEAEERGTVVLRVLDVVVGVDEVRLCVALQRAAFVHKGNVLAARLVRTRRVKGRAVHRVGLVHPLTKHGQRGVVGGEHAIEPKQQSQVLDGSAETDKDDGIVGASGDAQARDVARVFDALVEARKGHVADGRPVQRQRAREGHDEHGGRECAAQRARGGRAFGRGAHPRTAFGFARRRRRRGRSHAHITTEQHAHSRLVVGRGCLGISFYARGTGIYSPLCY